MSVNRNENDIPQLIYLITQNGGKPSQWTDIANQINSNSIKSKVFVSEIKRLLKDNSPNNALMLLNIVDYIVDECSLSLHTQISSRDFITTMLSLLKLKDHKDIQEKVLILIKKWGVKFENQRDVLPNFYETYSSLKKNGIVFPMEIKNDYMKYLSNQEKEFNPFNMSNIAGNEQETSLIKDNININSISNSNQLIIKKPKSDKEVKESDYNKLTPNYGDICLPLELERYPKDYHSFVVDLKTILETITLANDLITNADYKSSRVDEAARDMFVYIQNMSQTIRQALETQIENEDIMMICLGINEDIERVMNRFEQLLQQEKPSQFVSVFKSDYEKYDLMKENQSQNKIHDKPKEPLEVKQSESLVKNQPQNENLLSFDVQPVNVQLNNMNINSGNDSSKQEQEIKPSVNQIRDINDIFDFTNQK